MGTFGVAPLAGAWIEMPWSWEGGCLGVVAPLAGAWIEMYWVISWYVLSTVAPLAGAWIEISLISCIAFLSLSLPSRERGLKYQEEGPARQKGERSLPSRERGLKFACAVRDGSAADVAPLAGAWIEIRVRSKA